MVNNNMVTFAGNPVTLLGNEIKAGVKAPDFCVLGNDLKPVNLSDYKGKVIILSIFPSVDTDVCSAQAHHFNKEASQLSDEIQILTLSNDLPFALGRYCDAEGINNLITLSDHRDLDFGLKYGFVIKELRLLTRGIVIVDKQGIVQHVEYVPEITQEPNYEITLDVARKLV